MQQLNCGCGSVQYAKEYKIPDNSSDLINTSISLLAIKNDKIDCLKRKVITDYLDILDKLECGIQSDIENILQEISLIDMKTNQSFSVTKKVYSSSTEDEDDKYLKRFEYLGEYESQTEKNKVLENLGISNMKHVVIPKSQFDEDNYEEDVIYFVTEG